MRAILLLLFATLVSASPAQATFIDAGTVTLDSSTNLEWLDIDESLGFSWNEIENGVGGFVAAGWRHATSLEVCTLFANGGVAPPSCPGGDTIFAPTSEQLATFSQFRSLFGFVLVSNVGYPYLTTHGFYSDPDGSANGVGYAAVVFSSIGSVSSSVQDNGVYPTLLNSGFGVAHWLVHPVPEPASAVLVVLGLVACFGRRLLRKRSLHHESGAGVDELEAEGSRALAQASEDA